MSCRLKVSPSSGILAPDATQSVTLIFIMPSMRGIYSTNLQLTALGASNSPVTVPVSVTMKESPLTITEFPIPRLAVPLQVSRAVRMATSGSPSRMGTRLDGLRL